MTTSEPTTGEIVRALRCSYNHRMRRCADRDCIGCEFDASDQIMPNELIQADRLESQEREIEELSKEPDFGDLTEEKDCAISLLASLVRTHPQWKPTVNVTLGLIAKLFDSRSRLVTAVSELTLQVGELTARAEQAEKELDAARKDIDMANATETGMGLCLICKTQCADASNGCFFCTNFKWRGHPQDGDGK